jgi:hypothetical protein
LESAAIRDFRATGPSVDSAVERRKPPGAPRPAIPIRPAPAGALRLAARAGRVSAFDARGGVCYHLTPSKRAGETRNAETPPKAEKP